MAFTFAREGGSASAGPPAYDQVIHLVHWLRGVPAHHYCSGMIIPMDERAPSGDLPRCEDCSIIEITHQVCFHCGVDTW